MGYVDVPAEPGCRFVLFVSVRHVFLSTVRVPVKSTVIPWCSQIADKRVSYEFVVANEAVGQESELLFIVLLYHV